MKHHSDIKNRHFTKLTIFSAIALFSVSVFSQEKAENSDVKKKRKSVEEMVVVGYRYPTSLQNVAGSVTLIDSEEIESIQASNIADILENQPGVEVESDARFGIRSINVRGLSGNYVKIKVDNVDQPAEFDGGTFIGSSRIDLDVDLLKMIEVVKGPASSTQGSEAIGGSVLFSTIDPVDMLGQKGDGITGWLKSSVHSVDDGKSLSLAIANRQGDIESMLAYTKRTGDKIDSFGDVPDRESDADNVLGKVVYHLTESQQIKLSAELAQADSDGEPNNPGSYDDFYYTEDTSKRTRLGLSHQWESNNVMFDDSNIQLDWQKKQQDSNTFRKQLVGNAENKEYGYEEEGVQLDIQFTKTTFPLSKTGVTPQRRIYPQPVEHNFAYGLTLKQADYENINLTWYDDNGDGVINDRSRQYFYIPSAKSTATGVYFQDEIVLAQGRLRITPGIRFDQFTVDPQSLELDLGMELTGYSSTNTYEKYEDEEFTGRLGVVYAINNEVRIFSQYSQGFKSPDFRQLYYSWSNDMFGYKSEPNPDLTSEYSDSIELGLRGNSEFSDWEVVVFKSEYNDFIEQRSEYTDPNYPYGVTRFENIREAGIKGIELSSQIYLGPLNVIDGASIRFSAAYADGETGDGEPLESVNPFSAHLRLGYDAPSSLWGLALKINYADAVDRNDVIDPSTQYLPDSYMSMDLNAYWEPVKNLTLRAGVNNIADKQYERWSSVRGLSADNFEDRYSQPGRHWALTVKYQL
ncbi:MAG: TonB-dependent hemoglobin/transferrin/lactoferrin family receptor [Cellvibrionaceae bacterium]